MQETQGNGILLICHYHEGSGDYVVCDRNLALFPAVR